MNGRVWRLLLAVSRLQALPPEVKPLLRDLERARYAVFLAPPPIPGAYGSTDPKRKLIWVSPLAIEMGLARAVLIHEAIGDQLTCVYVDHGLIRAWESDQVVSLFRDHYNIPLIHAAA